jgi:poly(hydroxyalkanoate) depolymerase family esterase
LYAEQFGFLVLYPAQSNLANVNKCWNWYKPINQYRNMGEPAIIAGMTQKIISKYKINSNKVYIAGLSAGAAMAYIVGSLYSDMYAAIGVHSGLLYRGINNMFSALAAMKTGSEKIGNIEELQNDVASGASSNLAKQRVPQPLIIFHGDNDSVVHAQNAADLMAWHQQKNAFTQQHYEESSTPYSHTRTTYQNAKGQRLAEQWIIHGAGHAWSGGSVEGNFTDANGPDASREMVRFFMEQI